MNHDMLLQEGMIQAISLMLAVLKATVFRLSLFAFRLEPRALVNHELEEVSIATDHGWPASWPYRLEQRSS